MKLNLGPFSAAQQALVMKPEIGLETQIYFAPDEGVLLGSFLATGATAGGYVSAGGPQIPTGGRDVIAIISSPNGAVGSGAMRLTMSVVLADDGVDTAVADFTVPSYAQYQGNVWGFGVGRDLIPATPENAAKKIKSITSFSACANLAAGIRMDLYAVPDAASYVAIGNTTSKELPSDAPMQVAIPEGYDPAAFTKVGRGEIPNLSVGFRYKGLHDQLTRFNGVPGTLRADVVKEGVVTTERHLFFGFRPMINVARGDGNEEVTGTASGVYRTQACGYGLGA